MNKSGALIEEQFANNFKLLAIKKPIEKITIKEITDLTGVIRSTFYNHFQDKYELLEWIVKHDLILPCQKELVEYHFEQAVINMLESIVDDAEFYKSCTKLTGQNSFFEIMSEGIRSMISSFLDEERLEKKLWFKWLTTKLIENFFSEAATSAIINWIDSDMRIPKEEIWECFVYLANHSILEMILIANEGEDD